MYFNRRRLSLVACLLFICLGVTACGSSPTTSSGSTKTATLTPLTVCQISKSVNFFPFEVAQKENYFTAQGLKVGDPNLLQVGSKVVAGVQSGSCDIGNGVMTDAFSWAKASSTARVISLLMGNYAIDIVVSKKLESETGVSASSPLDDKIKALKGKTVGITGPASGTQALLTYLFVKVGLNATKDTTQVSLGSNFTAALASLKAGKVDALSFAVPTGEAAVAQGIGDILISPLRGDIPGLSNDIQGVTYTKQSTIDAKPQAIAAYIRAINQAEVFIKNNPTQAKAILNTYLGLGQSVTDAVYTASATSMPANPAISEAQYNIAAQFHLSAGLITKIPPYSQIIATSTISSALK